MISLIMAYLTGSSLRKELEGVPKPSLVFLFLFTSTGAFFSLAQFIAFFGPLIGLVLGFDAINRERTARTPTKLVSQPIHRDSVINGKFLAGMATVTVLLTAIVLLISGLGLRTLGVVPATNEVGRLALYFVVSVFYVGFWLGNRDPGLGALPKHGDVRPRRARPLDPPGLFRPTGCDRGRRHDAIWQGTVRTAAVLQAQTPAAVDAIRTAIGSAVSAHDRDGVIELPMPALLAAAEKP